MLATVELLHGARDQRESLVSLAAQGVGGAEGRGEDWRPDDDVPRATELVAPLEDRGRASEIPRRRWAKPRPNSPKYSVRG